MPHIGAKPHDIKDRKYVRSVCLLLKSLANTKILSILYACFFFSETIGNYLYLEHLNTPSSKQLI